MPRNCDMCRCGDTAGRVMWRTVIGLLCMALRQNDLVRGTRAADQQHAASLDLILRFLGSKERTLDLHGALEGHLLALLAEHLRHLALVRLRRASSCCQQEKTCCAESDVPSDSTARPGPQLHAGLLCHRRQGCIAGLGCRCNMNLLNAGKLRTLSKVTLVRESNRPDWKCGTTEGGSDPRDRISSSVGSLTK